MLLKKRKSKGFGLIEVLVAGSLMAIVGSAFMIFMRDMQLGISTNRITAQRDATLQLLQQAISDPGVLNSSLLADIATPVTMFRNCLQTGDPSPCTENTLGNNAAGVPYSSLRDFAIECSAHPGLSTAPVHCAAVDAVEFELIDSSNRKLAGRSDINPVLYTADGALCAPGDSAEKCPFQAIALFRPQCASGISCDQATNIETLVVIRPALNGSGPVSPSNSRAPARILASNGASTIDVSRIVNLNTSCAPGQIYQGVDADGNADCVTASAACSDPVGERVHSVDFGARTVNCTAIALPPGAGVVPFDCGPGRYVQGIVGGNIICQNLPAPPPPPAPVTGTCPSGEMVVGLNANGVDCAPVPPEGGGYMEGYDNTCIFGNNKNGGSCSCDTSRFTPQQVFDFGNAGCAYYGPPVSNPVGGVCGARGFVCVAN